MHASYVASNYLTIFSGGKSESDDKFCILLVSSIGGGVSIINILTIIIACLCFKHYCYKDKRPHSPVKNNINSLIGASAKLHPNPAYGSFQDRKPPDQIEKRCEMYNAAYISATMGSIVKPLYANNTLTDADIVRNTTSVHNDMNDVIGVDVKLQPNPAYGLFADDGNHCADVVNTYASVEITTVSNSAADNCWTEADDLANPAFEAATTKINVNPTYATIK